MRCMCACACECVRVNACALRSGRLWLACTVGEQGSQAARQSRDHWLCVRAGITGCVLEQAQPAATNHSGEVCSLASTLMQRVRVTGSPCAGRAHIPVGH